jgi:hypothetical protein
MNYVQLDAIFGAPLSTVVKPKASFNLKPWHLVVGAIGIGVFCYGLYSIKRNYFEIKKPEDRNNIQS